MKTSAQRFGITFVAIMVMLFLCSQAMSAPAAPSDTPLLQENFQQFDQSLETGWRVLQLKRSYLGAADAIQDYMTIHSAQLKPWQKDSLAFHLGHIYAMADRREEAVIWLKKSIADHLAGNDSYVDAYVAFLENDKAALAMARHTIATTHPGPWRAEDLREVDAMLDYFGEPFEAAWGALNCHNPAIKSTTEAWTKYCTAVDAKYRDLYQKHGIKVAVTPDDSRADTRVSGG